MNHSHKQKNASVKKQTEMNGHYYTIPFGSREENGVKLPLPV
jgi:hypothetical protein